jgi:hypothetical protein
MEFVILFAIHAPYAILAVFDVETVDAMIETMDSGAVKNAVAFVGRKRQIAVFYIRAVVGEVAVFTIHENARPTRDVFLKGFELLEKRLSEVEIHAIFRGVEIVVPPFVLVDDFKRTARGIESDDGFSGFVTFVVVEIFFIAKGQTSQLTTVGALVGQRGVKLSVGFFFAREITE